MSDAWRSRYRYFVQLNANKKATREEGKRQCIHGSEHVLDRWGLDKAPYMQILERYEDKDGLVVYQMGDENGADSEEE